MSLDSIKVGDEVTVIGMRGTPACICKVAHRTAATMITAGGNRYQAKTGRQIGGAKWTYLSLVPTTQAHKDHLRAEQLAARLGNYSFRQLPLEKLESIAAIVWEKPEAKP